ncbi:MAG: hypothetical protein ABIE94_04930 [archaeon]
MSKKTKKGQMDELGAIVLAAVVLVVIVFVIIMVRNAQTTEIADLKCTESIQSHINTIRLFLPPEPIVCPTQYVDMSGSDKMNIKAKLAQEQVLCWHQWAKGEENLFPEDEGVFCHVCYVNEFKGRSAKIDDYVEYLETHKVSDVAKKISTYERQDPKIIDYLSPYSTESFEKVVGEKEGVLEDLKITSIDTSEDQAVIFFYVKGETAIHDFAEKLFVGSAIVAGGWTVTALLTSMMSSSPAFGPAGLIVAGVSAVGLTVATLILRQEGLQARLAGTTILPWTENTLVELNCTYIPVSQAEANT